MTSMKGKFKIHCADKNYITLKTGRTIPVYLVDEEIYAKCPTVDYLDCKLILQASWSERVGLLFGRTDCRYCVDVDILLLEETRSMICRCRSGIGKG